MQKKMYLLVVLSVAAVLFLSSCTESPFSFSYTGDYCADGLQDRDEEGVDCGGQYCDACTDAGTAPETPAAVETPAAGTGEEGSSCISDEGCISHSCVENVCVGGEPEVVETPGVPYCADTDNGDIYTGGTATAFDGTDTLKYNDFCDTETKTLTEYSCTPEGNLNEISVECAFGCRDTTACLEEGIQDPDGDGLSNDDETGYRTDQFKADSDYDDLTDYQEVITYGTDPNNRDTDGDGIKDGNEVLVQETDPFNVDTDVDGLSDYVEVKGTNGYFTRATDPDTDGDEYLDGVEIEYGTDPLSSTDYPIGLIKYDQITVTLPDDTYYILTLDATSTTECSFEYSVGEETSVATTTISLGETKSLGSLEVTVVDATDELCTIVTNGHL